MAKFKRVCVFCGSHSGNREVFSDAANELGNELASLQSLFIAITSSVICYCVFHVCWVLDGVYLLKVRRKIDLIYGGGSVGLMGLISKTLHTGGCHVLG